MGEMNSEHRPLLLTLYFTRVDAAAAGMSLQNAGNLLTGWRGVQGGRAHPRAPAVVPRAVRLLSLSFQLTLPVDP